MRIEKTIDIGGSEVTVRELTVAEVRAWLKELLGMDADGVDVVGQGLFSECTLAELARMTDLSITDMDGMSDSELRQVIAAAKELNPSFFALRGRVFATGEQALK